MKIRIMVFLASLLCTIGSHAHVIVGFSPEGSAQKLVMNTLNIARHSINLMGYSFTSPEVVKALIGALMYAWCSIAKPTRAERA